MATHIELDPEEVEMLVSSDSDDDEARTAIAPLPQTTQVDVDMDAQSLEPLISTLNELCENLGMATDDAQRYEPADPIDQATRVLRIFAGSGHTWLQDDDDRVHLELRNFVSATWQLSEEIARVCGGAVHVPPEYRRRIERMFETISIVRDLLVRMRRMSMLRAPECTFLESNQRLRQAFEASQSTNGRRSDGGRSEFHMGECVWDCTCSAMHGVGRVEEDNSNPIRDRPIGADDELVDAAGKHVRWAWLPPPAINIDKLKPFQRFVLYLLEQARLRGLRRYGKGIYTRVVTSGSRFTPAWKRLGDVAEFVRGEVIDRNISFQNWSDATTEKGNISAAIDYLEKCNDASLPVLQKSRRIFAFRNGIYVTYLRAPGQPYVDHFHPYDSPRPLPVPNASNLAAAKYFDRDCRYGEFTGAWYNIPTPAFDSILQYQKLPVNVQRWTWALLGRLLHETNDLDRWQVALVLRGVAQSGKSTIADFWRGFYEIEDIGILANTIETTFGWSPLSDKLIVIGPELKQEFCRNVDIATLQSVISGEMVSLAVKNHDPITLRWLSHALMVGNDQFAFGDSSGQVARRLVIVEFMEKVTSLDSSLPSRLEEERDLILVKANKAYIAAVNYAGTRELWACMPDYFKAIRDAAFESNNSIAHLLKNGPFEFGVDKVMPLGAFQKIHAQHCLSFALRKMAFTHLTYCTPFGAKNITLSNDRQSIDWHGNPVTDLVLKGVDVDDPSLAAKMASTS